MHVSVCMGMAVDLVREYMMKDMIDILRTSDPKFRTRQGADAAEKAEADIGKGLKDLIKQVVEECVNLDSANPKDSQTLEQALCECLCVCLCVCMYC